MRAVVDRAVRKAGVTAGAPAGHLIPGLILRRTHSNVRHPGAVWTARPVAGVAVPTGPLVLGRLRGRASSLGLGHPGLLLAHRPLLELRRRVSDIARRGDSLGAQSDPDIGKGPEDAHVRDPLLQPLPDRVPHLRAVGRHVSALPRQQAGDRRLVVAVGSEPHRRADPGVRDHVLGQLEHRQGLLESTGPLAPQRLYELEIQTVQIVHGSDRVIRDARTGRPGPRGGSPQRRGPRTGHRTRSPRPRSRPTCSRRRS